MRFDKAFKEMIDNYQPITRTVESWDNSCLLYNEATNEIEFTNDSVSNWEPTHEDILATDWIMI